MSFSLLNSSFLKKLVLKVFLYTCTTLSQDFNVPRFHLSHILTQAFVPQLGPLFNCKTNCIARFSLFVPSMEGVNFCAACMK